MDILRFEVVLAVVDRGSPPVDQASSEEPSGSSSSSGSTKSSGATESRNSRNSATSASGSEWFAR